MLTKEPAKATNNPHSRKMNEELLRSSRDRTIMVLGNVVMQSKLASAILENHVSVVNKVGGGC